MIEEDLDAKIAKITQEIDRLVEMKQALIDLKAKLDSDPKLAGEIGHYVGMLGKKR